MNNIEAVEQKADHLISAMVLTKLIDKLFVHRDRNALRLGVIELIDEFYQPNCIKLFICGLRGIIAHRGQPINKIMIRDSLVSTSMPIPLGKNKIIYKTVESKEVQIFTYNDSNLIDMYVPIMQGSIVGAVLVLKQVCSSMVNDVVWQHILTSYTHLNQMLYTAEIDPLTGLMNRLAFERLLNRQAENISIVEGVNTYFSLVDIDFFKKINDNFGHLYGDEVLILLTRAMMESFRSIDWLFRYGGEEFGIVLIDVDCTEAYQALERFRIKIETMTFPQVGTVTVSIGFSQMNRLEPISSLVDRADHALYYVKNHGRNQVLCYENLREEGLLTETEQETKEIELF